MKRSFALLLLAILACVLTLPLTVARMDRVPSATKPDPTPPEPVQQQAPKVTGELIATPRQDPDLAAAFREYDLIRLDPGAAAQQVRDTGVLSINTSRGKFSIKVSPHDMRSSDYEAQVVTDNGVVKLPRSPITTYKGKISEDETAQVRLNVKEDSIEGAILTDQERLFLQPARAISKKARADEFVFYKGTDVKGEAGTCAVTLAEEVAAREDVTPMVADETVLPKKVGTKNILDPLSPMKVIRLATDADGEYFTALGSAPNVNAKIQEIMNLVEGTYELELGLTFDIIFQNVWDNAATDPYTTAEPGGDDGLLREFRNRWEDAGANPNFKEGVAATRTLAHLWTGRDLQGSTIGIAFTGVTCRAPTFAYGLSQQFPFGSTDVTSDTVVLTAHEMGHNFSAGHTNEPDEFIPADIEIPCDNTIMEAAVGDGSNFCPFSRSQIIGFAQSYGSCLSAGDPPSVNTCNETPIATNGTPVNGTIALTDCRSPFRGVSHFADRYTFNANAGQQLTITYNGTSGDLDPYIYLIGPDGQAIAQDDDSNCNLNSRIPFFGGCNGTPSGVFTLPMTGKYIIEATSYDSNEIGNYTITTTFANCTLTATAPTQNFAAAGGAGTVNVTATGAGCGMYNFTRFPSDATGDWLSPAVSSDTGTKTLNFTVAANSNPFGRKGFLLIGAGASTTQNAARLIYGGIRIPISQSGTTADCVVTPIAFGQTINGNLANTDCLSPVRGAGTNDDGSPANGLHSDRYSFTATAGQKVSILMASTVIDTFLTLIGPNGDVILTDDDSGGPGNDPGQTDSRIPGGTGMLTLGVPGTYIIEAGSFGPGDFGNYSLTLNTAQAGVLQFSQAAANIAEDGGSITLTVNRSVDTNGPATVKYATSDNSGMNACNAVNTTFANSRCDYGITVGTLRFVDGQTSQTITIPIIDDSYVEGNETFTVTLSDPVGATLGVQTTVTVTITDNDVGAHGPNPVDTAGFFVRQHYIDFLNREPDAPGLAFWTNEITSCAADAQCIEVKRINVSAAFYISIEFQQTGYLVYRIYKAAFGNMTGAPVPVNLENFLPDTQEIGRGVVVGQGNWEQLLDDNKNAFVTEFVTRPEFVAAHPTNTTPAVFVDALFANAGVTPSAGDRQAAIDEFGGAGTSGDTAARGRALRKVAENVLLEQQEFNRAFVLMQYFGYLRRSPNSAPDTNFDGYNFWLNKLNDFNGNFVNAEMVKAFILAGEYRERFGP